MAMPLLEVEACLQFGNDRHGTIDAAGPPRDITVLDVLLGLLQRMYGAVIEDNDKLQRISRFDGGVPVPLRLLAGDHCDSWVWI